MNVKNMYFCVRHANSYKTEQADLERGLRSLVALAKDPSLFPSTHIGKFTIPYNFRFRGIHVLFWPPWVHTHK